MTSETKTDYLAHFNHNQKTNMHYKNGREAKNGDKIILIQPNGGLAAGVLYNATAGNDFCNGRIATIRTDDPYPNLKEVLHADDVAAATIPDSTKTTA